MGKTTTHPDGSTTTPGTQITTDQGTGEAKAETETETQETGDKQRTRRRARSTWTRSWAMLART